MKRWLITHDAGISADTPPRLWRVWVGMPTTGRRTWGLVTMLRCSLNLSGGLAAKSDGAIPLTCGLPSGVAGNDVGAHPLRRLADDLVDDRPEVSGPVVHGKLAIG